MTAQETADRLLAELGASGLIDSATVEPMAKTDTTVYLVCRPVGHKARAIFEVHASGMVSLLGATRGSSRIIVFPPDRTVAVLETYLALRKLGRW